jgi:hypothetical protein
MFGVSPADLSQPINISRLVFEHSRGYAMDGPLLLGGGDEIWGEEIVRGRGSMVRFLNGGLMAGNHRTFMELNEVLRSMAPYAIQWIENAPTGVTWRDEHVYNLALHHMAAARPLELCWNVSLHVWDLIEGIEVSGEGVDFHAKIVKNYPKQDIKILHFSDRSKQTCAHWRGHFRQVKLPEPQQVNFRSGYIY